MTPLPQEPPEIIKAIDLEVLKRLIEGVPALPTLEQVPYHFSWRNIYAEHAQALGYKAERGPGASGITILTNGGVKLAALHIEKRGSFYMRDLILRALKCAEQRLLRDTTAQALASAKDGKAIATLPRAMGKSTSIMPMLLASAALGALPPPSPRKVQ